MGTQGRQLGGPISFWNVKSFVLVLKCMSKPCPTAMYGNKNVRCTNKLSWGWKTQTYTRVHTHSQSLSHIHREIKAEKRDMRATFFSFLSNAVHPELLLWQPVIYPSAAWFIFIQVSCPKPITEQSYPELTILHPSVIREMCKIIIINP